jgi:murein tripeptide amidase MpaA
MQIRSDFDSGNIIVEHIESHSAALSIRPDSQARFFQWFYFQAIDEVNTKRRFQIVNAGQASYPQAWPGYRVLASYNEIDWFRIPTHYDGTNLIFEHEADQQTVSYAFFVPYTADRRSALLRDCQSSGRAAVRSIGQSYQGRSIDLITIGAPDRPLPKLWMITRQHAGEPMAEWATEGFVRRLLDETDSVAAALLERATIYVIPNINPDGSILGNLRANAAGIDLNRAWDKPSDQCPEIQAGLDAMQTIGVDALLDMHGDEERPFIWIFQPDVPQTPALAQLQQQFEAELSRLNPELQPAPTSITNVTPANLGMLTNYVVAKFNRPSWTIELPFKEPAGMSADTLLAEGCMRFGRTCVDALTSIVNQITTL